MKEIIYAVAENTKDAIRKTARSINQNKPNPELNISLSRLVDSFSKLISGTNPSAENGWYSEMEKKFMAAHEERQRLKEEEEGEKQIIRLKQE